MTLNVYRYKDKDNTEYNDKDFDGDIYINKCYKVTINL